MLWDNTCIITALMIMATMVMTPTAGFLQVMSITMEVI